MEDSYSRHALRGGGLVALFGTVGWGATSALPILAQAWFAFQAWQIV